MLFKILCFTLLLRRLKIALHTFRFHIPSTNNVSGYKDTVFIVLSALFKCCFIKI